MPFPFANEAKEFNILMKSSLVATFRRAGIKAVMYLTPLIALSAALYVYRR